MLVALLVAAQAQIVLPFERDVLLTDDGALHLLSPIHVAGPEVQRWAWSPDRKYLAVLTAELNRELAKPQAAKPGGTLSVWDLAAQRNTEVYRHREAQMKDFDWMAGNRLLFLTAATLPSGPARPQPETESVVRRWFPGGPPGAEPQIVLRNVRADNATLLLNPSPKQPYAVAYLMQDQAWIIGPQGLARPIRHPGGWTHIDPDGWIYMGLNVRPRADQREAVPGRRTVGHWERLELTGEWTRIEDQPPHEEMDPTPDPGKGAATATSTTAAYGPVQVRLQSGWLAGRYKNKPSAALVSAEAKATELAGESGVLYLAQGSLFYRPIRRMTLAEYEQMYEAAERAELMSRAKQVGIAAFIFAADNDDRFPGKQGFNDQILPYLKNADLLQGFVYSLNGENGQSIAEPAKTVMGYIHGRNGRAVLYADSHVRWEPNKP